MSERAWDGEQVDFVDGVVFGGHESYLTLGRWTDRIDGSEGTEGQGHPSDYTGQLRLLPLDPAPAP